MLVWNLRGSVPSTRLRTTALRDQKPYLVVHVSRKLFCWGDAMEILIRGYVPAVHHRLVLLSSEKNNAHYKFTKISIPNMEAVAQPA